LPRFECNKTKKQIYIIVSVDTEHDIISKYSTKVAGWSKGIPLLFKVFDALGMRSKVCWLIEYNLKDGILAANPHSEFFVKEFPELLMKIKKRGDELGIHPTMHDWLGGDKNISVNSYNDPNLWDFTRSYYDPEFVLKVITSGTKEFRKVCGINPIGCRTGAFHYATNLAPALEKNGIYIDGSVAREFKQWIMAPNAYYAARDDIRNNAHEETSVLEIPVTGYIDNKPLNFLLKLRAWFIVHQRHAIFLSFFIHNWQAINYGGREDIQFLKNLSSFLGFLKNQGAYFLSWSEAYEMYKNMYRNSNKKMYAIAKQ